MSTFSEFGIKLEQHRFNMLKRGINLLVLLVLPAVAVSLQTEQAQIDYYLQVAAEHNPELRAEFHRYLAALQDVPQVQALPDPELAFGYFINPVETRVGPQNIRIGLTQMFPWFGTLNRRKDVVSNRALAQFQVFQETRNALFYQIKNLWYELYETARSISIMQENIEILSTFESLAIRRYEAALVSQVDVLRVQIEKEDLKTRLELLEDERKVLVDNFNNLLNTPEPILPQSPDTMRAESLERTQIELEQAVMRQNPRIVKLEYETEANRSSINLAKREGLPQLGLGFDYIITGSRTDMAFTNNGSDALLGRIGIKLPLYRSKYRAKEEQAKLEMESTLNQKVALKNKLSTRFSEALSDYRDGSRRLRLYRNIQIQRTRQAIDVLIEQYSSASTDFEELLRMQRRLLDYELSREKAIVDQNRAVAYIEYLTGRYNIKPEDLLNQD